MSQDRNPVDQPAKDAELRQALVRLAGQVPTYGYRRLTAMLEREGFAADSKPVHRLMNKEGILGSRLVRL